MGAVPIVRDDRIRLGERIVAFRLYRVPRRRHVHVLVDEDGQLEVRAPWRYSIDDAHAAIHEHRAWVLSALEDTRSRVRMRPRLVTGGELPLLGERLRLRVHMDAQLPLFVDDGATSRVEGAVQRRGRELAVQVHRIDQGAIRRLLESWYRDQAAVILRARMEPLAEKLGVAIERITIRAQRSRWGSCSASGTISLNWRLLLMPADLCDYVLAHELCHLIELNHSPAFWRQVQHLIPDYRERRRRFDAASRTLAL